MLVTDVEDQMCWWQVSDVGDRFRSWISGWLWQIWYIEKITNVTKKVVNIMILPPTSQISHHHKVTNITMSPTSLFPNYFVQTLKLIVNNHLHYCNHICIPWLTLHLKSTIHYCCRHQGYYINRLHKVSHGKLPRNHNSFQMQQQGWVYFIGLISSFIYDSWRMTHTVWVIWLSYSLSYKPYQVPPFWQTGVPVPVHP